MSLKGKIIVILTVVIIFCAMINYFVINRLIYPTFSKLEEQTATANLLRVEAVFKSELEHLSTIAQAWTYRDDIYRFVQTGHQAYIEASPEIDSLRSLNLNTILFYNAIGELIWGKVIDLTSGEILPLENLFSQPLATASDLLRHAPQHSIQNGSTGFIATNYGPMLMSRLAILTSTGTGPSAGTMIIGRFLNEAALKAYRTRTNVDFQLIAPSGTVDGATFPTSKGRLVHHNTPQTLYTSTVLNDVYGTPYLILRTSTARDITTLGSFVLHAAMLALLVAGLINLSVIWLLLKQFIIRPLMQLKNHILTIRTYGVEDPTILINTWDSRRRDEIGVLSNEFDDMVRKLASARRQLIDKSFKAGMAETAAGILHNLRNALVPLTHQIDEMSTACLEAPGTRLEQAIDLLTASEMASERRARLVDYAKLAARQLIEMRTEIADQLSVANQQIDHIEAILSDQERLTEAEPVIEALCLTDVINEAMCILPGNDSVYVEVALDDTLATVGSVNAHQLSLVKVFGKLLLNASESIQRAGQASGRIALQAARQRFDNRTMIQIQLDDNGEGIDPAMLTAIFQHDYSPKRTVKDGLGLHWCANTITSMGGVLQASSDGLGYGAQFSILLPAAETS